MVDIASGDSIKNRESFPQKFLVVDDVIAEKKSYQEDFIIDLGVSENLALFASSYDEALETIKKHSDIVICYIDCRIPKESNGIYSFEPTNIVEGVEWGISLIPQINRILSETAIAVYSAYTSINYIMDRVNKFKNIVDCYSNYGDSHQKFDKKKLYKAAIEKNSLLNSSENKKFDYTLLDTKTRLLVQNRTIEIKNLLRRSAQDIVDIGKYLIEVKSHLGHGQFYPLLQAGWCRVPPG